MPMSGGFGGISAFMIGGIVVSNSFLPDQNDDVMVGAVGYWKLEL